jgi:hypothetical protein
MATWKETYVNLAVAFDATLSDPTEDFAHLQEARFALVDLTAIPDGSEPSFGTEVLTELMREVDLLVRQSKLYFRYEPYRNHVVKSINDLTILHYGDLDDFVNGLDWPDLCAPVYWAFITEETGTDTSNWIVCS